ncbi:hypothetical protein [Catellatospora coxensis]|uniref:PknH-like protein n=1 Tax=Catellatospora coxensis TaxID=310354 RepID=A0A8J3P6A2_9ACTN|nr:hypothetical protein [Catellatospora coxensis]GIG05551.1 hypothetical protein Cco03nite_22510 [Catellatospora coxensis]
MRDDISQQLDGFGADMPATTWASPAEIRGRGERRRRVRTVGMTAAGVAALAVVAGAAFVLGGRPGEPAPTLTARPSITVVPQLSPSPSVRPRLTSPSPAVPFDTVIPLDAMLRAADVSPAHRVQGGEYLGENYRYVTGLCQEKGQWDGKPVRPQLSGARDSSRQRVLAAGQDAVHVVQQVTGYGSARSAGELIAHERAGFEHCAVLDHRETHVEFEIIATGFAGDEALLVRMSPRTLLVLVRVGAVYTELSLTFPATPGAADVALAQDLADKAVARICAATTAC